jgi:hypothetical protein
VRLVDVLKPAVNGIVPLKNGFMAKSPENIFVKEEKQNDKENLRKMPLEGNWFAGSGACRRYGVYGVPK